MCESIRAILEALEALALPGAVLWPVEVLDHFATAQPPDDETAEEYGLIRRAAAWARLIHFPRGKGLESGPAPAPSHTDHCVASRPRWVESIDESAEHEGSALDWLATYVNERVAAGSGLEMVREQIRCAQIRGLPEPARVRSDRRNRMLAIDRLSGPVGPVGARVVALRDETGRIVGSYCRPGRILPQRAPYPYVRETAADRARQAAQRSRAETIRHLGLLHRQGAIPSADYQSAVALLREAQLTARTAAA